MGTLNDYSRRQQLRPHENRPGESLSAFHTVYGLSIIADCPIPGLPPLASQAAESDLRVHLKDAGAIPEDISDSAASVYTSPALDDSGRPTLCVSSFAAGKYFSFFYADGARFTVDCTGRELWADWPEGYFLEDAATYLVGPVLGFVLRLQGITPLHASAVAIESRAIALVGAPGAGKSTTAAAFAHRGAPVLSDDVVAVSDAEDSFLVAPGYPRVNLWPDSVRALLGSEDALPRITPTWGKHFLPLEQNGRPFQSEPLPLGAIYVLGERDPDLPAPLIEDLPACEALMTLVSNTYVNYLLDREMRHREFDLLSRLVSTIPVRRVRPRTDPAGVLGMCDAIAEDARRVMQQLPDCVALGAD
jgi:hypothetical protein